MKNPKKGGFKFLFLFFLFLALIVYGCADDGGGFGSNLTGIDAEASGFASTGGITLPASIENADTIPADDIDMRTSTGDTTSNEEWLTDEDTINTSITLPSSVAKLAMKAFVDGPAYTVAVWLVNEAGSTNIDFIWQGIGLLFTGSLPVDYTTSYFCFVVSETNVVIYRSHFRKITKAYGVTGLNPALGDAFEISWTNPTNAEFGSCQVWYGTNSTASIRLPGDYVDGYAYILYPDMEAQGIDPFSTQVIVRVVSLDKDGKPYAASAVIFSGT